MKLFNKNLYLMGAMALSLGVMSCDDVFEPAPERFWDEAYLQSHGDIAEGILDIAYSANPMGNYSWNEVATDDAVSNEANNAWTTMATGSWKADNSQVSRWDLRTIIQYLNIFLKNNENTLYVNDEKANKLFQMRNKGEAYAFRALMNYYLLEAYAGPVNGTMMGIPIVNEIEDVNTNFNYPRNTFDECIKAIYADIEEALKYIPEIYEDIPASTKAVEDFYNKAVAEIGVTDLQYNKVMGYWFSGRMCGQIAKLVRAKAALLAASPAFNKENDSQKWQYAADCFGELLNNIGGLAGLDNDHIYWYNSDKYLDNFSLEDKGGANFDVTRAMLREFFWRNSKETTESDIEVNNYPPSLEGNGRINPTQNFVDCFPTAEGYPINHASSNYDAAKMYDNRDPRLDHNVYHHGSKTTANDITLLEGNDAIGALANRSSRTGYYLRKLINEKVSKDSKGTINAKERVNPKVRYTEIFLSYAEALNEAQGASAKGNANCSAKEVIAAIRKRGGIETDKYIDEAAASQDLMRDLIRNERRIELSFEGHRFYDLKRWMMLDKIDNCQGVRVAGSADAPTYTIFNVEQRAYKDYQNYAPLPYTETIKWSQLSQNDNW